MNHATILIIIYYIVTIILIAIVLNVIQGKKNKRFKDELEKLEREKNLITSKPILSEISKVEDLVKSSKLDQQFKEWHDRYDFIKKKKIPEITDMLIDVDGSLEQMDYRAVVYKLAKVEIEIYKVRTMAESLLKEIRNISVSEEANRKTITGYKATYREQYQAFTKNRNDYGEIAESIELQFETIEQLFEKFEELMDQNDIEGINEVIKTVDGLTKHMKVVLEEVPGLVLIVYTMIPKKSEELRELYKRMTRDGYVLDYLNLEYNLDEIEKKVTAISEKLRVLNLEDSVFEAKTMLEYCDSIYDEFEKEKLSKKAYEEDVIILKQKINKLRKVMHDIFSQISDLKVAYDLSDEDIQELTRLNGELEALNTDYHVLIDHTGNHTFAFSKLASEVEILNNKLLVIQNSLDSILENIGNMKDDEVRARRELEEIKNLLKKAKLKIRDYKLPVIPEHYYVQLKEAAEGIKEIIKELDKKPIAISVLNVRVDTARDLVLKLFHTTNEMMKTAMLAEMAIIYGNRYRGTKPQIEQGLNHAEIMFFNGSYKNALESSINTIELVEPGIYERLLNVYGNEVSVNK